MTKKRLDYSAAGLRKITKAENPVAYKAKRFVVEATGKEISGAMARKLAGSTAPSRQPKAAKPRKPNKRYTDFITKFVDKQNKKRAADNLPANYTRGEARTNPEFQKAYAALRREGKKKKVDLSAHSKLAMALEDLGIREENADYPVGETPD